MTSTSAPGKSIIRTAINDYRSRLPVRAKRVRVSRSRIEDATVVLCDAACDVIARYAVTPWGPRWANYTSSQVLRRGWGKRALVQLLGKPDARREWKRQVLDVYDAVRVEQFEPGALELTAKHKAEAEARSARAKMVAAERKQRRVAELACMRPIPPAGSEELALAYAQQLDEVAAVYEGSSASATRRLLERLAAWPPYGPLAASLLRAQKASSRAKRYHGDSRGYSYARKSDEIDAICELMAEIDLTWGWAIDRCSYVPWVLYVDLPNGQVSFHAPERGAGPEYDAEWDGQHCSERRIIQFAAAVMVHPDNPADVLSPSVRRRSSRTHSGGCTHGGGAAQSVTISTKLTALANAGEGR